VTIMKMTPMDVRTRDTKVEWKSRTDEMRSLLMTPTMERRETSTTIMKREEENHGSDATEENIDSKRHQQDHREVRDEELIAVGQPHEERDNLKTPTGER